LLASARSSAPGRGAAPVPPCVYIGSVVSDRIR
jgi:hypothetical protein